MTEQQLLAYSPAPPARPVSPQGESPALIDLPHPDLDSGPPLMTALAARMSAREFTATPLPPAGRLTPSAHAFNEIDVYVALPYGAYRYDAPAHRLVLKHAVDARNLTGYQDFVGRAPLDLVYVVRTSAILDMPPQQRDVFSAIAAGAIAQNVSLYCAAAGLGTVVRGWINHRALADALRLNEDELPILAQTVGYRAGGTGSNA